MTVQAVTSRADYSGNGVATAFAVPFYFLDATHLKVLRTQISTGVITTLALTTDYTVSGAGVGAGGTVTMVVAPTSDQKLSILRNVPLTQLAHYVPNDPFPAATHEQALDQLTMEVQQVNEVAGRALTLPANTPANTVSTSLPTPQASKLIGWDSAGTGLQNVDPTTLATIVAFGTANADTFTGTGSQTAFTLTANPGAQANLDVSVGGVTQLPGVDYVWTGGTTVTFTTAPPSGVKVLLRYFQALPQGTTDSGASTFSQSGSYGSGTVGKALKDRGVCPADAPYNGDPTGVVDATAAVQAALDSGRPVYLGGYTFRLTGQINVPSGTTIVGPGTLIVDHTGTGLGKTAGTIARCRLSNFKILCNQNAAIAVDMNQWQYCELIGLMVGSYTGSTKFTRAFKLSNVAYWNVMVDVEVAEATIGWDLNDANDGYYYACKHVKFGSIGITNTVVYSGACSGTRWFGLSAESVFVSANVISFDPACELNTFVGLRIECRAGSSGTTAIKFNGATENSIIDPQILSATTAFDAYRGNLILFQDGFGAGTKSLGDGQLLIPGSTGDPGAAGALLYRTDTDRLRGYIGGSARSIPMSPAVEMLEMNGYPLNNVGSLTLNVGASSPGAGKVNIGSTTATTVGAAGGASALPATPLGYLIAYVGTTQVKIPYYNA